MNLLPFIYTKSENRFLKLKNDHSDSFIRVFICCDNRNSFNPLKATWSLLNVISLKIFIFYYFKV